MTEVESDEFDADRERLPSITPEEWAESAAGWYDRWNFDRCLGSMDGKHIYKNSGI